MRSGKTTFGSSATSWGSWRRSAVALGLGGCLALLAPVGAGAQNSNMGETYSGLDAQVTRVTTQFVDAYAITQRTKSGDLETQLFDAAGAKLAGMNVAVADRVVELEGDPGVKSAAPFSLFLDQPTSDWANAQIYGMWRDQGAVAAGGKRGALGAAGSWEWRDGFLRLEGAAIGEKAGGDPASDRILGVTTRFGEIEAVSVRNMAPSTGLTKDGKAILLPTFTTRLVDQRSGRPVGRASWYESTKTFIWDLPGLSSGRVDEERMEQSFPFQPNQAWSNVQVFGLMQMHLALAVRNADDPYAKNEPGCDGLHWLDNTIFRPCCDTHDLCYEKYGCSARSWWFFGSSWKCIRCNLSVVFCFLTGGGGGGGGGGTNCGEGSNPGEIEYQCI